jgi:hypothetical protein
MQLRQHAVAALHSRGTLPGSFGEILGGKPVRVFLCHRPVSSIHPSNELMRRCLLRWEYETPRRAFCRIWQRFLRGSFKDRFSGHLATRCGIKCNSLAPKIARLLPGSDMGVVKAPVCNPITLPLSYLLPTTEERQNAWGLVIWKDCPCNDFNALLECCSVGIIQPTPLLHILCMKLLRPV